MNPVHRMALSIAAGCALLAPVAATAADHQEAPGTQADPTADIADLYAWHDSAEDKLVLVLTYNGLATPPGRQPKTQYDMNVEYAFHLDRDGDQAADRTIRVRFEPGTRGKSGKPDMVVENLPGTSETIRFRAGQKANLKGFGQAYAGPFDDPFFFDLEGFLQTLQTGTLSFDGTRDSVAGSNATAIVLEMSLAAAIDGGTKLDIWATTARK